MSGVRRIAFIGNSLPRRCGIATFTTDLQHAAASCPTVFTSILAMHRRGRTYDYPPSVRTEIRQDVLDDYWPPHVHQHWSFDAVSLQHEFGIFGGEAGEHILALLSRLTMPVVTVRFTPCSQSLRKSSDACWSA